MPKRTKKTVLNSESRESVIRLREYFKRENQNGEPLLPLEKVCDRVADALGIVRSTGGSYQQRKLPKTKRDIKKTKDLCNCRPVCKNRRREWKGEIQQTSGELLIERKPIAECIRQWPTRVYPNSPCPLFGKSKKVITERYSHKPSVVRICQAPIDLVVPTPYLKAAKLVTENGALDLVDTRNCPFCTCGECCPCTPKEYPLHDPDREATRRTSMRAFDARVKDEIKQFRVMYN